jgi:GT2 family glycosyltransferase
MKVAVVILNWNGRDFLEKFLPSVLANNSSQAEIIVADNDSTDDSLSFLHTHYPHIRIIKNATNGGFAKGYNDALKQVDAEYYVLLNSDVEVTPNWIDPIIACMDADKNIAACQPKIKDYNNKAYFEYAGAAGGFIDKFGYPFCRGRIFDTVEQDLGQYDDECEIFWATGACLFIRAEYYHMVKGLDEDFFAHMEEIDLCWSLKNLGYSILYCPSSTIYHVGGGTLKKENPHKTYLNFRNNIYLMIKNGRKKGLFLTIFVRFVLDGIAGLKFLVSGNGGAFLAVVKAHLSIYPSIGMMLKKRKALQASIKNYPDTATYPHSIVYTYFVLGKKKFSELKA